MPEKEGSSCGLKGLLLIVALVHLFSAASAQTARETREQFLARTKWWREAKFGMFIHWGIYAVPADCTDLRGNKSIAEWYMSNKQMQVKDYEKVRRPI